MKISILFLILILIFSAIYISDMKTEKPIQQHVVIAEHKLCDVEIFEEVQTNAMGGIIRTDTMCRYSYIGFDNVIYTETKFVNAVQLQNSSKSKLVRYSNDATIYLCLSEELYSKLYK